MHRQTCMHAILSVCTYACVSVLLPVHPHKYSCVYPASLIRSGYNNNKNNSTSNNNNNTNNSTYTTTTTTSSNNNNSTSTSNSNAKARTTSTAPAPAAATAATVLKQQQQRQQQPQRSSGCRAIGWKTPMSFGPWSHLRCCSVLR